MALENLKAFIQFWYSPRSRGGADENPLGVIEGRNIMFFAQECFPGRRLIVSAHNGHLARGTAQIEELEKERGYKFNETILTGQRVHDAMGDAVYSLMAIAHGGETNDWSGGPRALSPPPRDSLEDLMHRTGLEYAFVDLRGRPHDHWLRAQLVARPVSYAPMRADWSRVYDGVLFINSMTPTTPADDTP